jgi:ribosomal protein S18 acetylase RimI-like enzyme
MKTGVTDEDAQAAFRIRPYTVTDSLAEITVLLHRAYRPLAEAGMRYLASHQDEETTRERLEHGQSFVVECAGRVVGTISLYGPSLTSTCAFYRRPDVWHFGQFAVEPELQGRGIGSALLSAVEASAREAGASELALDTSEHADALITFYERYGFRKVGEVEWTGVTNYRSVVLSKSLVK